MDDFIVRALLAGIGVAIVAGPLGCFIVWRRMAYFGAALSHSALLGVALGLIVGIDLKLGILFVAAAMSLLLVALQRQQQLAIDTLLGVLAHSALAFGVIAISFLDAVRVDLMGYLFGDILAVSWRDLVWIFLGGGISLVILIYIWRPLLSATVNEELARVEGENVDRLNLVFMLLVSLVVAIAMQLVGIVLIISMLILPAASARRLATTPETMALFAIVCGVIATAGGLGMSLQWDTPAGPSVIICATLLFALSRVLPMHGSHGQ